MALVVNIDQEKYQKLLGENLEEASVVTEVIRRLADLWK